MFFFLASAAPAAMQTLMEAGSWGCGNPTGAGVCLRCTVFSFCVFAKKTKKIVSAHEKRL